MRAMEWRVIMNVHFMVNENVFAQWGGYDRCCVIVLGMDMDWEEKRSNL
jgi:hypothetical protein